MNDYDIIFLGFQDSFGAFSVNKGMSLASSEALQKYILSGKAIVFTQDTISTEHIPVYNYPQVNSSGVRVDGDLFGNYYFSSYYFNNVIRGVVGMDKYGVVSEKYGLSQYSYFGTLDAYNQNTKYVTTGYQGVDNNIATQIEDDGYAVAYKPGSGRTEYVEETHGFTTYLTVLKPSNSGQLEATVSDDGNYSIANFHFTNEISQVNKGQITSFPYNVNTAFYNNTAERSNYQTQDILSTSTYDGNYHKLDNTSNNQYTQVNLYDEDVTVWYTLANDKDGDNVSTSPGFTNHYNDVSNAFYIFSKGNITYTGAGNANQVPQGIEKNLFINTMIASYRPVEIAPEITISDSVGGESITNLYITTTLDLNFSNGVLGQTDGEKQTIDINTLSEDERKIYFYVENNSIGQRTLEISLRYGLGVNGALGEDTDGDGEFDVFYGSTIKATALNENSVNSSTLYYFTLTQEMLDLISNSDDFSMLAWAEVRTTVNGEPVVVTSDYLKISALGLLPLI